MHTFQRTQRLIAALACLAALAACTQTTSLTTREYFDTNTGSNVSASGKAAMFYKAAPLLAANAYDFVHVGPVEISRGGARSNWIWIACRSSIDRGLNNTDTGKPVLNRVVLLLDGEPMELMDNGQQPELSAQARPYTMPFEPAQEAYFAVSADQIERLGSASTIRVFLDSDSAYGGSYQSWLEPDVDKNNNNDNN